MNQQCPRHIWYAISIVWADPADGIKKYFVIKQLCRRHRWYFSFNAFEDSVTAFKDSTASAVSQAPLMLNQIPLMQLQKSLKNLWCLRHCCCRIRKVSADTNNTTLIPAVYCESLLLLFKGNYFEKNVYYKYGSQQLLKATKFVHLILRQKLNQCCYRHHSMLMKL